MPPRLPLTERLGSKPFVCTNCRYKQGISSLDGAFRPRRNTKLHVRKASTIPSVTAVNVRREIPHNFQKLYTSLKKLEQDAGVYINTSQLQLALRGLESENAVTRIAVLGLNGSTGARRLLRVLLADPLAGEAPWEKQLVSADGTDGRAILLRYGEQSAFDDRHPLVRTFSIPSSILQTHKLEILVHTISPSSGSPHESAASLLVPSLDIANSNSGRLSTVTYPVHKVLLYQEGLKDLGIFGTLDNDVDNRMGSSMFKGVIDWSWSTSQQRNSMDQPTSPINLAMAEAAIETFRRSLDKSIQYEHLWFDAGMPGISTWLSEGTEIEVGAMKPATGRLVQMIINNASQGIVTEESLRLQKEKAAMVPLATKDVISQGISLWAENAHTELRDRLNSAFYSKDWRKTKWWKLFWRADDIGYITANILQRAWLVEAEKGMIWLTGRIHQSGLLGPPKLRPAQVPDPEDEQQKFGRVPPAPSAADLMPRILDFKEPPAVKHPWPQNVSSARSALSSLTVPLQALAQALLIQTVSTNVLTTSLSALVYISVSSTSPYESGAIAATGLVFSLRRLQKRWEVARNEWESQTREEGRRVLRQVESLMREATEGGKPDVDEVGIRERAAAMDAVGKVREALEELRV